MLSAFQAGRVRRALILAPPSLVGVWIHQTETVLRHFIELQKRLSVVNYSSDVTGTKRKEDLRHVRSTGKPFWWLPLIH